MKKTGTKDKILTEALKLFAQKGYESVSVIEIAEAVGIKAPSLYKHYKSKRDIFDSILNKVCKMDAQKANEYDMPEKPIEEDCDSYKGISSEKIGAYTKAMFLHWTKEEFFCCFRRLLTLEQYKNPEMAELYRQYVSDGPVQYMADVFRSMTNSKQEALQAALEFYGPMYLLYSIYDAAEDKEKVILLLEKHIESFFEKYVR